MKFGIYPYKDLYVLSDFELSYRTMKKYFAGGKWVDANLLYGERITEITEDSKKFHKHFIMHISVYDVQLKRLVLGLMKNFGVKSRDFRCDFFLTRKGGYLPEHIDSESRSAILVPLNKNTGSLLIRDRNGETLSVNYQNAIYFNTQNPHSVESPESDRLIFRIGIHDQYFKNLLEEAP